MNSASSAASAAALAASWSARNLENSSGFTAVVTVSPTVSGAAGALGSARVPSVAAAFPASAIICAAQVDPPEQLSPATATLAIVGRGGR